MVRINIRRNQADLDAMALGHIVEHPNLVVETSADGSGWYTQYIVAVDPVEVSCDMVRLERDETLRAHAIQENEACRMARCFKAGVEYGGAEASITMFGYTI